MAPSLLYVTADGLLEPLGYSQVLRVVEGLARKGWCYRVLSLEKPNDLKHVERVRQVRQRLQAAGVEWSARPYDWSGTASAAVTNLRTLCAETMHLVRRKGVTGIHARAYHGVFAAHAAWWAHRTPYLFDTRSYWFDERLEEGRWFTTPIRLGLARGFEYQFFAQAAGIVSLTELQATDVRRGHFGPPGARPVICIPTCADYDDFRRRPIAQCHRVPLPLRSQLAGKLVLGIVGSLNRSYLVDETMGLVRRVMSLHPNAHVLVVTGQVDEYQRRLAKSGVNASRTTVTKAEHDAMPDWLSLMHWGLLLLDPQSPAKRASMPTKLAEFFAAGVRPVQFGCNSEVASWVERAGTGLVLTRVDAAGLDEAAQRLVDFELPAGALERGRAISAEHFSLETGLTRYDAVLRQTFGNPKSCDTASL